MPFDLFHSGGSDASCSTYKFQVRNFFIHLFLSTITLLSYSLLISLRVQYIRFNLITSRACVPLTSYLIFAQNRMIIVKKVEDCLRLLPQSSPSMSNRVYPTIPGQCRTNRINRWIVLKAPPKTGQTTFFKHFFNENKVLWHNVKFFCIFSGNTTTI